MAIRRGTEALVRPRRLRVAGSLAAAAVLAAGLVSPAGADTVPFTQQNNRQDFPVPAGVCTITVDVIGAAGGNADFNSGPGSTPGGRGAHVTATIPVTPGEHLGVFVGSTGGFGVGGPTGGGGGHTGGAGGFNGGADGGDASATGSQFITGAGAGGGGASDVRQIPGGTGCVPCVTPVPGTGTEVAVVIAGGGGGAGGNDSTFSGAPAGGAGGGVAAGSPNGSGGNGGAGATGGVAGASGGAGGGPNGTAGASGSGGTGGDNGGNGTGAGGGGGGGATGGGGGGGAPSAVNGGAGGGGGSSAVTAAGATAITFVAGENTGTGSVVFTFTVTGLPACVPATGTPSAAPATAVVAPARFTG